MKGRFAPSPTGRMHIGNVYAALISWLSARSRGGSWLLRHEDLDSGRSSLEYARLIEQDLMWLGLDWDEGGLEARNAVEGVSYLQSRRSTIYRSEFEKIRSLTYPCWCTRADIYSAGAPHESDGRCRQYIGRTDVPDTQASTRLMVRDCVISFTDRHYGNIDCNLATQCGDFIVRRKDGGWTYQFAVVVDDALMGITEVVRGRDLLLSTAQQIYLCDLLGYDIPSYSHLPLLCNGTGQRLSKRDGSGRIDRFKYPEQLTGHIAFLSGLTERDEPCRPEELVKVFNWNKIPVQDIVCP